MGSLGVLSQAILVVRGGGGANQKFSLLRGLFSDFKITKGSFSRVGGGANTNLSSAERGPFPFRKGVLSILEKGPFNLGKGSL